MRRRQVLQDFIAGFFIGVFIGAVIILFFKFAVGRFAHACAILAWSLHASCHSLFGSIQRSIVHFALALAVRLW